MRVWELEGEIAVLFFVLLVPVLLLPFLRRIYRRWGRFAGWPAALLVAAGLFGCALVAFTLFPLPDADALRCTKGALTNYWQLRPLASLDDATAEVGRVGIVSTLASGVFLQVLFNVVFFVPLGFLAAYRLRAGVVPTLVVGFGVSLLIEVTQGTAVWGIYDCPYRFADVDDLITNTAGAGIGWLIGSAVSGRAPFDPDVSPDLGRPSLVRRATATVADVVSVALAHFLLQVVAIGLVLESGGDPEDLHVRGMAHALLLAPGVGLLLVMPLLRADRATPGGWATCLALPESGGGAPASSRSVAIRFAVRWLPWLVTASPIVLLAVLAAEGVTAAVRGDRRTLSDVAAGTETVTARRLGGAEPRAEPHLAR